MAFQPLCDRCGSETFRVLEFTEPRQAWSGPPASQHPASFFKLQARISRKQLAGIPMPDITQEIRLPLPVRKELFVDLLLIEPRHRSAVESQSPCGQNKIGS